MCALYLNLNVELKEHVSVADRNGFMRKVTP